MDELENLLAEPILKRNVEFAALFVLNYESLKQYVVDQVRGFYAEAITFDGDEIKYKESDEYKKQVRKLDTQIDTASMKWFMDAGAITEQELDLYHTCRKRRNDIIHELLKNLSLGFNENDVELFSNMVHLYQKIDNWWINEIEIPTLADEIPADYNRDQVFSGQAFILSAINDIILLNGSDNYSEILKLFRKMKKEKTNGQECN